MKAAFSIAGSISFLLVGLSILVFGLRHLDLVLTLTTEIADVAFALVIFCLLLALFPATRIIAGKAIAVSSYFLGINVWVAGAYAVLHLWGLMPLIGGLLFFGIGPVPMGIIALLFHNQASEAGMLFLSLVVMLLTRFAGVWIATSGEKRKEKKELERGMTSHWKRTRPERAV